MSDGPESAETAGSATFGATTAIGSACVNQIGQFQSVNTYIYADKEDQSVETKCRSLLEFDGIYAKQRTIELITDTCTWLLDCDEYQRWLATPNTILWIEGHPGAGKSAAMRFMSQLGSSSADDRLVASFFFNARGQRDERTLRGLLLSLLHELSGKNQRCVELLTERFRMNDKFLHQGWTWTSEELKDLTLQMCREITPIHGIHVYVDALDEAEDGNAILNFLEDLMSQGNTIQSNLNLCLSCRHYPNLRRSPDFCIDIEAGNKTDLEKYAKESLRGLNVEKEELESLRELLVSQASGIFQWLVLVSAEVRTMLQDGETYMDIEREIRKLPADLDELYSGLLHSITARTRLQSLRLFQWICFAYRPISILETRHVIAFDRDSNWNSMNDYTDSRNSKWIEDQSKLEDRLKALSKGLVCCTKQISTESSSNPTIVVFIHQSVQEYMISKGLAILSNSNMEWAKPVELGHAELCRTCLLYMTLCLRWAASPAAEQEVSLEAYSTWFSLLSYCVIYWGQHAREAERIPNFEEEVVRILQWPSKELTDDWCLSWNISAATLSLPNMARVDESMELVNICSFLDLPKTTRLLVEKSDTQLDCEDGWHRTPLSWAAQQGHVDIVLVLVQTGKVNLNHVDAFGKTPLTLAIRCGHKNVTRLLLDHGADPNYREDRSSLAAPNSVSQAGEAYTTKGSFVAPLVEATRLGHTDMVQLLVNTPKIDMKLAWNAIALLDASATGHADICRILIARPDIDVNFQDGIGETALHLAVTYGYSEIVRLLLAVAGINILLQNNDGRTPVDIAQLRNYQEAINLLEMYSGI